MFKHLIDWLHRRYGTPYRATIYVKGIARENGKESPYYFADSRDFNDAMSRPPSLVVFPKERQIVLDAVQVAFSIIQTDEDKDITEIFNGVRGR